MYFFTFCNYINRISTNDLEDALYMLLSSMKKFIPKYELICFINYKVNFHRFKDFNVKFAKYYNDNSLSIYNKNTGSGLWLNMSFWHRKLYFRSEIMFFILSLLFVIQIFRFEQ